MSDQEGQDLDVVYDGILAQLVKMINNPRDWVIYKNK
jgi:hypothetical protein